MKSSVHKPCQKIWMDDYIKIVPLNCSTFRFFCDWQGLILYFRGTGCMFLIGKHSLSDSDCFPFPSRPVSQRLRFMQFYLRSSKLHIESEYTQIYTPFMDIHTTKTFSFRFVLHWQKDVMHMSRMLWGLIQLIRYPRTRSEDHVAA